MTKIYYSLTDRDDEYKALKAEKVEAVLVSFALWQKKPLRLIEEELGYRPKSIIIDPGAVTFSGANISTGICDVFDFYTGDGYSVEEAAKEILEWAMHARDFDRTPFFQYLIYLMENKKYIDYVLSFDDMFYTQASFYMYELMKAMNFSPIPVFHFKGKAYRQEHYFHDLDYFVDQGNEIIALGGILSTKVINERIEFVRECLERYPQQKFHLLGCQRKSIIKQFPGLYSCDGNAWKITAGYKKNRKPGQTKVQKSIELIRALKKVENNIG